MSLGVWAGQLWRTTAFREAAGRQQCSGTWHRLEPCSVACRVWRAAVPAWSRSGPSLLSQILPCAPSLLRATVNSSLFATHHHDLTQEPAMTALVQLGRMEVAVDQRRGLLPSSRPAPGGLAERSEEAVGS